MTGRLQVVTLEDDRVFGLILVGTVERGSLSAGMWSIVDGRTVIIRELLDETGEVLTEAKKSSMIKVAVAGAVTKQMLAELVSMEIEFEDTRIVGQKSAKLKPSVA